MNQQDQILVLNCGSSSVKFALYAADAEPAKLWAGAIERIGLEDARFYVRTRPGGLTLFDERIDVPDHEQALAAVGHRVAHGGPLWDCPNIVDDALKDRLRTLVPFAPLHLPGNVAGIAKIKDARPVWSANNQLHQS